MKQLQQAESSRTDLDDDVVDVTLSSALDVVLVDADLSHVQLLAPQNSKLGREKKK